MIKLCVRTLLIADSEAMSHFCIHIKYASRCYPPQKKNTNVNNQPKVAIIVPVYNVASYLRECLNSILTQTYTNFTVFAVDDGSTDESGAILDEYAATDTRIVAIHQKNAGQGAARNNALARIETLGTFDYVTFADGDDKVYNGFVDQLVKTAERTSADISICAFHYLEADGVHAYGRLHEEMVLDKDAYFEFVISAGARPEYHGIIGTGGMVWNKLFSARALQGVRFLTGKDVVEDELFCVQVGECSKKNVYFPEVLYIYRQRPDSDVKQNSIYRKMLLARIKTLPHAFSTRTELVATAALVAASVDYFKRYEELPPLDLHVHKQEAITACNDGHLRKRTLKRFLLICDHPRLARFYLTQRRIVNVAMFWKRH